VHEDLWCLAVVAGVVALVQWCERAGIRATFDEAQVEVAVPAVWADEPPTSLRTFHQAVALRHARALAAAAHAPIPCPMCQENDIRRACVAVGIVRAPGVSPHVELWCVDCAPLVTGGWVADRPAPAEARCR